MLVFANAPASMRKCLARQDVPGRNTCSSGAHCEEWYRAPIPHRYLPLEVEPSCPWAIGQILRGVRAELADDPGEVPGIIEVGKAIAALR